MMTDTDSSVIASMPGDGQERRRAARLRRALAATVKTKDGVKHGCVTRDISAAGVFFYCAAEFVGQSAVELVMTLPPDITCSNTQWVCAHATVVRVEPNLSERGHGIAARIEQLVFMPEPRGLSTGKHNRDF